jgi:hypothetical protein
MRGLLLALLVLESSWCVKVVVEPPTPPSPSAPPATTTPPAPSPSPTETPKPVPSPSPIASPIPNGCLLTGCVEDHESCIKGCDGTWSCTSVVPECFPSPAPSPVVGVSDVVKIAMFHYDNATQGCKTAGQPFVMPAGCEAIHITLTPKDKLERDAQHHGRDLTWKANGVAIPDGDDDACVDVGPGLVCGGAGGELTFNRTVKRAPGRKGGTITLQAVLVAPDGVRHETSKSVTIP